MAKDKGGLAILIAGGKPKPPPQSGAGTDETTTSEAGDQYEEAEGSYPEFDIPRGLDLGDMDVGDEREVMAKIRLKEGGTACVTEIEGVDLAGGGAAPGEAPGGAPPPPPPPGGPGGGPAAIRSRAIGAGLM